MKRLLLTFRVRSFRSREALSVTKAQVVGLYRIQAFSASLGTVRYVRFEKLANGQHIERGRRVPLIIRESIMNHSRSGKSIQEISEKILDEFGVILTFEAVQRWSKK